MNIGYTRVSTKDQSVDRQIQDLLIAGVEERNIYIDKQTGSNFDRPFYQALKLYLREGDVVFFTSLDRMGRNYQEICLEWSAITKEKGADIVVLDMPVLDTRNVNGDLTGVLISNIVIHLLGYVSEKELLSIKARQRQGIDAARSRGAYAGRKPKSIDVAQFVKLHQEIVLNERSVSSVVSKLGISRSTYYTLVSEYNSRSGRFSSLYNH